ncbi:MAG TPA: c-type cytochrome domain-containing protein [Terriglobia bacterium]|nr:c-type cytochrome domain-containing protein [Terriglobia bacterium]
MRLPRPKDDRPASRRRIGVLLVLSGVTIALAAGHTTLAAPQKTGPQLAAQPDAKVSPQPAPALVSYFKDIRPIVREQCAGCHQPSVKQGELTLTTYEGFMAGGAKGKVVKPGDPDQSLVIAYLTGAQKPQMPFGQTPLSAAQIDLFRNWIRGGAPDDTPAEARSILEPGKPVVYHAAPVITALAYSPDGGLLAVSGYREVLLHKGDGSGLVARLPGISDKITSLAFSADGSVLAAVGGTPATFGEVELWDVAQRKLLRSLRFTDDTLFGASFSPDGSKLAFGGTDNTIHVIEVATGKELLAVKQHDGWVFSTVFSQDGSQIVSVSRDGAAKLTNVTGGVFVENINQLKGELVTVARQPKRDVVLVGGDEGVPRLYLMHRPKALVIGDTSTLIREFEKQDGPVVSVAFSPDGQWIAVGGSTDEVRVYKTDTGERVADFKGHEGGVYTVVFAPDGAHLAAAGFDGTVRIYDVKAGRLAKAFVPVPLEKETAVSLK